MGLDQFAYKTKLKLSKPVDFQDEVYQTDESSQEFFYWRKHPNLQGWMEKLYFKKGGNRTPFNCAPLELVQEDIDNLVNDILDSNLPRTTGFFFGESNAEEEQEKTDLDFCKKASDAIKNGYKVFYDSWW